MQNLAYKIDVPPGSSESAGDSRTSQGDADVCAACGEPLFGPDAGSCSLQAWGSFWGIMDMSNVELLCGACSEYLSNFFRDQK